MMNFLYLPSKKKQIKPLKITKKKKKKKKKKSYVYTPTRIVSWCLPSNGENSLMHTSKPLELTFSNHTYTASLGFVARVYFAETNTKGLAAKLWNICKSSLFRLLLVV